MNNNGLNHWLSRKEGKELPDELSAAERKELARFDRLWEAAAPPEDKTFSVDTDAAWNKIDERLFGGEAKIRTLEVKRDRSFNTGLFLKIAAALTVLAVVVFLLRNVISEGGVSSRIMTYAATVAPAEFDLPDGSNIYLNKGSELTYQTVGNNRQVTLSGEAFFDVARDEDRPFSIVTGSLTTTVLGTSFSIRAYPDQPRTISVKSGKVAVEDADESIILTKDEQVVYQPATQQLEAKASVAVDPEAWRTGALNFTAVPLSGVISTLESFYGTQIEVQNEDLLKCPFAGDFTGENLDVVLDNLRFVLSVEVEQKGERILLSGGHCN